MRNYIQPGHVMDYQSAAAVKSGELLHAGELFVVAVTDIPAGGVGACAISGVVRLPKDNAAIAQGVKVYANTAGKITATATDNELAGIAFAPATAEAATVDVLLNGLPGPGIY